jgi:hypothetical protein
MGSGSGKVKVKTVIKTMRMKHEDPTKPKDEGRT